MLNTDDNKEREDSFFVCFFLFVSFFLKGWLLMEAPEKGLAVLTWNFVVRREKRRSKRAVWWDSGVDVISSNHCNCQHQGRNE